MIVKEDYVCKFKARNNAIIGNSKFIYIIELKYDGTAEVALRQIKEKKYARSYQTGSRKLFKIGVAFSSNTRCFEDWKNRRVNNIYGLVFILA